MGEVRVYSFDRGIMRSNMYQDLWNFLCNFKGNRNKGTATVSVVAVTVELLALGL